MIATCAAYDAIDLFATLRSLGVGLEIVDGCLQVTAPKGLITPDLRDAMTAHKVDLMALLARDDCELGWRIRVMIRQVPPMGAIPTLTARPGLFIEEWDRRALPRPAFYRCHSCGDRLEEDGYICGLCSSAKHYALGLVTANPYDGGIRSWLN